MTTEPNTFPQFGDPDDAARFAQLIGHDALTDYVATGLELDADFSSSELHVSEGVFYVSRESQMAGSDGKEIHSLGYVSQVGSETLALPDSGSRYVVADSDVNTTDNPHVDLYEDDSEIPEAALVIGTVDVDDEVVTESNRSPEASFESIDATTVSTTRSVKSSQTLSVDEDSGVVISGPLELDGVLDVDGSLTDTIGPIHGTGSITGSGRIRASGGRHIEPIDPEIDGNTFIVKSGWQTSLTKDSYDSYRFGNVATLKIEEDESLSFEV